MGCDGVGAEGFWGFRNMNGGFNLFTASFHGQRKIPQIVEC